MMEKIKFYLTTLEFIFLSQAADEKLAAEASLTLSHPLSHLTPRIPKQDPKQQQCTKADMVNIVRSMNTQTVMDQSLSK